MKRRRRSYAGFKLSSTGTLFMLLGGAALVGVAVAFRKELASGAQIVAAQASNVVDHASFAAEAWKAVQTSSAQDFPLKSKLFIIAMAVWETGWGSQGTFQRTNNMFNITAGPAWTGDTIDGPDKECDANGQNCKPIVQHWRAYPNMTESVNDFLKFIQGARYADAYDRLKNGDISFVDVLHAGKYFTGNVDEYRSNVASIANSVGRMVA